MRVLKTTGVLVMLALLGGTLTACAVNPQSAANWSTIDCSDVSAQAKTAKTELKTAQAAQKDGKGTPAEVQAAADITSAKSAIAQLNARASECEDTEEEDATPASETAKECSATWKMVPADHTDNRWFFDGVAEIKTAATPKQAANAARVWLDRVKTDEGLLAGAAKVILQREVDKTTLIAADGCATEAAVDLYAEIAMTVASAQSIVPESAPADGWNSGVNNDNVIGDTGSGISGDRTAIKIVLPDGRVIWVLARCGNIATPRTPPLPPGQTDEKRPQDDPGPRGNAPDGSGQNENSGPDVYIPREEMEDPPDTPRVNPEPPPPTPPTPPTVTPENPTPPDPVPTEDPAPPPPPEVVAPVVPETGCIPIPGVVTCP